ncbi:MAG: hypothetical protein K2J96_02965 [Bacteroidaceae bacterium]|nr:hypothetical protein [Bacteroidaceae bacterium]
MKKFLFLTLSVVASAAWADNYSYLTVGYNSVEKSIVLEPVQKITFANGQMLVTTSNGTEAFPQNQLEKMFFSTVPTAIESVQANASSSEQTEGAIYDLSGRRVSDAALSAKALKKGLYIVNGRKVVIK